MAKTLQFRRDTTANLASVTGAVGEIFIDLTKDTVVVMDGSTAGGKPLATESYVTTAVSNLVDAAPGTLDTLNELAAALGDDANFATTISTTIGVAGSYANSAYTQANTATTNAATADQRAVTSGVYANTGLQRANTAGSYANSAYTKANTAQLHAQAAFNTANTAGANQSLNTTDNVVFASGLIGEVSIVANTVSALDSYGMPGGTLIIDGNISIPTIDPLAIGSYMFLRLSSSYGSNVLPGQDVISTTASGPLSAAGVKTTGAVVNWTNVDGTWRCMGYAGVSTESSHISTLWYRVS
jgi:hypothetical protein